MAVSDNTILLLLVSVLNYGLIWNRNSYIARIIGDIFFMIIGFTSYLIVPAPVTDWPWGILIAIIAGIDLLLNVFE